MTAPAAPPPGELIVYGAGGHGQVVAEFAHAAGWRVLGFIDDRPPGTTVNGLPVLERAILTQRRATLAIAIGDNRTRQRLTLECRDLGHSFLTLIHPTASISPSARLGTGVFVGPFAVINPFAQIGDGVIVNTAAVVEHHVRLGDFAHVAPRSVVAGGASVGALTLIGTGASIIPGIVIGERCILGAGAAAVRNIPDGITAVGVPARPMRST